MKKLLYTLAAFAAATLLLASCSSDNQPGGSDLSRAIELTADESETVANLNHFSTTFMTEAIRSKGRENVVVSPLGVGVTLGMIANGLEPTALEEVVNAFGTDAIDLASLNSLCNKLLTELPTLDRRSKLALSNAVWVNELQPLPASYTSILEESYLAKVDLADFSNKGALLDAIDRWCKTATDGMLGRPIDQIEPEVVVMWLNAMYFKGNWKEKFSKKKNKDLIFHLEDGSQELTTMMSDERSAEWGVNERCQSIRLPFGNEAFALTIVLPHEGIAFSDFLASFTPAELDELRRSTTYPTKEITFPKFKFLTDIDVEGVLKGLNINAIFDVNAAPFSKIGNNNLVIGLFKQDATIEVNEDGAKAAAVTVAKGMDLMAGPPISSDPFIADRPFIYFISERTTGAILAGGAYQHP